MKWRSLLPFFLFTLLLLVLRTITLANLEEGARGQLHQHFVTHLCELLNDGLQGLLDLLRLVHLLSLARRHTVVLCCFLGFVFLGLFFCTLLVFFKYLLQFYQLIGQRGLSLLIFQLLLLPNLLLFLSLDHLQVGFLTIVAALIAHISLSIL